MRAWLFYPLHDFYTCWSFGVFSFFHSHAITFRLRGHVGMGVKEEEGVAGQAGGEERGAVWASRRKGEKKKRKNQKITGG